MTKFVVKGLHLFATVDASEFRLVNLLNFIQHVISNEIANAKVACFHVSIVLFYLFLVLPYIFCREMIKTLNPKYNVPNRDSLTNHLTPAWYGVEKSNLITDLKHVSNAAITADGWTSFSQKHTP